MNTCNSEGEEGPQNVVPKRRKVVSETEEECTNHIENKILDENIGIREVLEGSHLPSPKSDANIERSDPLSLVKLTRSGLLLLTFSPAHCPDVVDIVSNIMQFLESGSLKASLWILPIQSTCVLHCTLVSKLVADFMNHEGKELVRPMAMKKSEISMHEWKTFLVMSLVISISRLGTWLEGKLLRSLRILTT